MIGNDLIRQCGLTNLEMLVWACVMDGWDERDIMDIARISAKEFEKSKENLHKKLSKCVQEEIKKPLDLIFWNADTLEGVNDNIRYLENQRILTDCPDVTYYYSYENETYCIRGAYSDLKRDVIIVLDGPVVHHLQKIAPDYITSHSDPNPVIEQKHLEYCKPKIAKVLDALYRRKALFTLKVEYENALKEKAADMKETKSIVDEILFFKREFDLDYGDALILSYTLDGMDDVDVSAELGISPDIAASRKETIWKKVLDKTQAIFDEPRLIYDIHGLKIHRDELKRLFYRVHCPIEYIQDVDMGLTRYNLLLVGDVLVNHALTQIVAEALEGYHDRFDRYTDGMGGQKSIWIFLTDNMIDTILSEAQDIYDELSKRLHIYNTYLDLKERLNPMAAIHQREAELCFKHGLSKREAQILSRREAGQSYDAIMEEFGISKQTISTLYVRGKQKLTILQNEVEKEEN